MPANQAEHPRQGNASAPRPSRWRRRYQLKRSPCQISLIELSLALGKSSAVRKEISCPHNEIRPSVSTLRRSKGHTHGSVRWVGSDLYKCGSSDLPSWMCVLSSHDRNLRVMTSSDRKSVV